MRAILGEYGKVIICVIVTGIIFAYCFSLQSNSVAASLPSPEVKVKSEDSLSLVQDVSGRAKPTITVQSTKLAKNTVYNLLNASVVTAKNVNGTVLTCKVIRLEYPDGTVKTDGTADNFAKAFVSNKEGTAKVTYQAKENYKGRELITEKTFAFVID